MIKKLIYTIHIFFIFFICLQTSAQNKRIDSLFHALGKSKNDTSKIGIYLNLCNEFSVINTDSSLMFGDSAKALINIYSKQYSSDFNFNKTFASVDRAIGNTYYNQGDYPQAITYYQNSLIISEKIKDKSGIARSTNNCGLIFSEQGNHKQALAYFEKSLQLEIELGHKRGVSSAYNNIAGVYLDLKEYEKALGYYKKALDIDKLLNDENGIAMCYNNIGEVFFRQQRFAQALDYYMKAYLIHIKYSDKQSITIALNNIANSYLKLGNYTLAINYSTQSMNYAIEIRSKDDIKESYLTLWQCYEKLKDYQKSFEHLKMYMCYKDSIFTSDKNKQIHQIEAIYQNEKKQKEIDLQNLTISKNQTEIKRQQVVIYSFVIGVILILAFSILLYNQYSMKKRANKLLTFQNAEILQQKEEIIAQRDNLEILNAELQQQKEEVAAQRDEIERQKNILSEQHKNITNSIKYAKKIQTAALPDQEQITKLFKDHFVIFIPKNIVSGDFYWVRQINEYLIYAIADCTGHGVPGAFMSMLGIAFLNEIVRRKDIVQADQVLNELRSQIIASLHQTGKIGETKDGMDIAFCAIDTKRHLLQFAGANCPIYIIRKKSENGVFEFIELKGDPMPIGTSINQDKLFTMQIFNLANEDKIYISTDGFYDQFGGIDGRKFLAKNFKNLLASIYQKPFDEQKDILINAINDWKGYRYEQVDDILVMGIRYKIES